MNCCPLEFRGGRKHVREGEKEQKMKALGFSKGGQLLLKHVRRAEKDEKMNRSRDGWQITVSFG